MGEITQDSDKTETAISAEDLDLISSNLEDESKDDAQLWNEIESDEAAASSEAADTDTDADADADADASKPAAESTVVAAKPQSEEKPEVDKDDDDIWAGSSDKQRAAFDAAQTDNTTLQHQLDSEKGRTKTYRRQLSDVTSQLDRAAAKPLTDEDKGKPEDSPAKDKKPDDWNELDKEYPEIAKPVGERLDRIEAAQQQQAKKDKDKQDDADADHFRAVETQTRLLAKEHKDWLEIATTPEFNGWIDNQPREERDIATRNAKEIVDARAAGELITRYKAFRLEQDKPARPDENQETVTSLAAKRKRQLEASASARPKGPGVVVSDIPEDGTDQEIWDGFDRKDAHEAAQA